MPLPLLPLVSFGLGAGMMGYTWHKAAKGKEEETFGDELVKVIRPVLLIIAAILLLRWLFSKGTISDRVRKELRISPPN